MYSADTRIIDLTVGELEEILTRYSQQPQPLQSAETEIIRGLKNIANVLKISEKTLQRWRKDKIITAPVIRQVCGVIIADKNDLLNFKKNIKK